MPEKNYPLTKEECLKIGGHCYEGEGYVTTTNPPVYHRTCKHCGHHQSGYPQSGVKWEDE